MCRANKALAVNGSVEAKLLLAIFLPIEIAASLANQGLTRVQWAHNLLLSAYQLNLVRMILVGNAVVKDKKSIDVVFNDILYLFPNILRPD